MSIAFTITPVYEAVVATGILTTAVHAALGKLNIHFYLTKGEIAAVNAVENVVVPPEFKALADAATAAIEAGIPKQDVAKAVALGAAQAVPAVVVTPTTQVSNLSPGATNK